MTRIRTTLLTTLALALLAPVASADAPRGWYGPHDGARAPDATPRPDGAHEAPRGLEAAILAETNLMRRDPRAYADKLRRLRPYYQGALLKVPGQTPILTREGVAALDEAIAALEATGPRPTLTWSDGLARGAADHARDLETAGYLGHTGTDGSSPDDRASRHGTWRGIVAENITFGSITAEDVVIDLLVDDGVRDRGHRRVLFNRELRVSGVACAPHPSYRQTCVMMYAGGFDDARPVASRRPEPPPRAAAPPRRAPTPPAAPTPSADRIISI